MFWTIVALVMTVLMGGIIAYNGDLIGRKYDKRRVSMFGLRPKHTAILITSVTGVLISAITTGVLFLLVPPVRKVILEGGTAIVTNISLTTKNRSLNAQLAAIQPQIEAKQRDLNSVQESLNRAHDELNQKKEALSRTQKTLQSAQSQLARACSQRDAALLEKEAARRDTRQQLTRNAELNKSNVNLAKQSHDLAKGNLQLYNEKGQLEQEIAVKTKYNTDLAKTNDELGEHNMKLVGENTQLEKQRDALQRIADSLRKEGDSLIETNRKLAGDNARLSADNAGLKDLVSRIAPGYENLWDAYRAMRNRRVIMHEGEELSRTVIPANASPETVRRMIDQLLHEASMNARAKGAADGDQARAVRVINREYFAPSANLRNPSDSKTRPVPIQLTEADRIDAMVSRLAWSPEPVCLLALAVANSVENEPAQIDFQPFTNRPIYKKGEVVAAQRVDATRSSAQIFMSLVDFLKATGQNALKDGMIPHIDPMTGEPQVGSVGAEELVKLVDRVREVGRHVRITAIAASSTDAADPLALEFKIEPSL